MTNPLAGTPTLMRVTATSGLKLRSAPAGDVLRTLAFEEQVTAFLDSAVPPPPNEPGGVTWVFVRDKDGTVGWTAKQYLAPLAEPPVTVTYTAEEHAALVSAFNDAQGTWSTLVDALDAYTDALDGLGKRIKGVDPTNSGGGF